MRGLIIVGLVVAVAIAGCVQPSADPVPTECKPGPDADPYPDDRVEAFGTVTVENGTARIVSCLVNGRDEPVEERCGSAAGPARLNVTRREDGEVVLQRPYRDVGHLAVCKEWTLQADAEWRPARLDLRWDLLKDVCRDDANCSASGEGDRVPGGPVRVSVDYPSFAAGWERVVALPAS